MMQTSAHSKAARMSTNSDCSEVSLGDSDAGDDDEWMVVLRNRFERVMARLMCVLEKVFKCWRNVCCDGVLKTGYGEVYIGGEWMITFLTMRKK